MSLLIGNKEEIKMNLQGKKVLVFGSGKSGIGAAELLAKVGAQPVIYDGNKGSGSAESWCTDGYSACKELL